MFKAGRFMHLISLEANSENLNNNTMIMAETIPFVFCLYTSYHIAQNDVKQKMFTYLTMHM